MKSIWKFPLNPLAPIMMPVGAKALSVHGQNNEVCLWAEVDIDAPKELRQFVIVGTGHKIPEKVGEFIGSALLDGGKYVFHVFESA
jgi:hypothetical protein